MLLSSSNSETTPTPPRRPDASVAIPLDENANETVSYVLALDGGHRRGDRGGLLVGTSAWRTLYATRAARRSEQ